MTVILLDLNSVKKPDVLNVVRNAVNSPSYHFKHVAQFQEWLWREVQKELTKGRSDAKR